MSAFATELCNCLGAMLREQVPIPEDAEPLTFVRQWLAERNLGLVPIDDPQAFAWPGQWLARVGNHAVVMFGSPSGPMHDPSGALRNGGVIDAGWVLAPLDFTLPTTAPYGTDAGAGSVAGLLVASSAEGRLVQVEEVVAIAGRGLEGDRYEAGRGTFSGKGRGYELTLVEAEVLDEIGLAWESARRNVVTRGGLRLNALVGRRFQIGAVVCIGRRLAEPCAHLERLARPGLLRPLVHRAGLRADILVGGRITLGDTVCAFDET